MTMGGHGQRPGIEPVDHSGRVLKGSELSFSRRILGLDYDPFVEFRHRDLQIDRGEAKGRVPSLNQLGDPAAAFAPEYLGVNAFRIDKHDFADAVDVAISWKLRPTIVPFGSRR